MLQGEENMWIASSKSSLESRNITYRNEISVEQICGPWLMQIKSPMIRGAFRNKKLTHTVSEPQRIGSSKLFFDRFIVNGEANVE